MKISKFLVVILVLISFVSLFILSIYPSTFVRNIINYDYFTVDEIKEHNQLLLSGTTTDGFKIDIKKEKYGITGLQYMNYNISGFDTNQDVKAYNSFEVFGLDSNTEYEITVSLNAKKNTKEDSAMQITYSTTEPDKSGTSELNQEVALNNLSTENNMHTYNLFNNNSYYQSKINVMTNEEGSANIVLLINNKNSKNLDYDLSNIKLNYKKINKEPVVENTFELGE